MGDRAADVIRILSSIIGIIAVSAVAFFIFSLVKRKTSDSMNQMVDVSIYTELDNKEITGTRVKQVIKQLKKSNCALLVNTLKFSGATLPVCKGRVDGKSTDANGVLVGRTDRVTINNNIKAETSINETFKKGLLKGTGVPFTMIENFTIKSPNGAIVYQPLCVNYGSILKNSMSSEPVGDSFKNAVMINPINKKWKFVGTGFRGYGKPIEYGQTIMWDDKKGCFLTKLDFAINSETSQVLKYNSTGALEKSGDCMNIKNDDKFNSYLLRNASGETVGIVFIQQRK